MAAWTSNPRLCINLCKCVKQFADGRRQIYRSAVCLKIVPSNLGNKSKSSQEWLTRQLNDPYVKRAKFENYRARSAFKLIEMDDKYQFLKPGQLVLDCGAAPGAWTQVATKRVNARCTGIIPADMFQNLVECLPRKVVDVQEATTLPRTWPTVRGTSIKNCPSIKDLHLFEQPRKYATFQSACKTRDPELAVGKVVAIDLNYTSPVEGAVIVSHADFMQQQSQQVLRQHFQGKKLDVVLSDMAPNATGISSLDNENIVCLTTSALAFAVQELKPGGAFLCKLWDGPKTHLVEKHMRKLFTCFKCIKPASSRSESAEIFFLGTDFVGFKPSLA